MNYRHAALALLFVPALALAQQTAHFGAAVGSWTGTNKLWLFNPRKPFLSEGAATVGLDELSYTWSYDGAPQHGELKLSQEGEETVGVWTDTWHSPQPMTLRGGAQGDHIALSGSYKVANGPAWGWRIELTTTEPFELRMFNITPRGKEQIAVEFVGTRAP